MVILIVYFCNMDILTKLVRVDLNCYRNKKLLNSIYHLKDKILI